MRTDTRDETDDMTTTHPLPGATAGDAEDDDMDPFEEARRARWTATGTGILLALAGTAAALLRLGGRTPALVPAAFATGAAICAFAAYLGSRGHTRRALWLLVLGVMVMAFGDQAH
ncbi:hypothetical protein [Streptomyces acidiscabies]|nr:hypothetical protein a10_07011 [Streptomyces acidiscabies]GAV43760.1 hypothetical protein Saa2_06716 [Streptomyces acidiscabies]